MEEKKLFEEEVGELLARPGNVRGEALKSHQSFIISKVGEEGFKKVENKLNEIGHPIDFKKIEPYKMYSASLAVLIILIAKEIFNWDDEVIKESGKFNIKNSFILKTFLRYFVSPKSLPDVLSKYWQKEYDFGTIEGVETGNEKELIVRVKDYNLHPLNCIAFIGVGEEVLKYVTRSSKIIIRETKCIHRGDEYHEYIVRWI